MYMKIKFFGSITKIIRSEDTDYSGVSDTDELEFKIKSDYPQLNNITYRIAVNHKIISAKTKLKDGDEIAFLPPFSGG